MDAAALNAITDIDVLRAVAREQIGQIAQRDLTIAQQMHTIEQRDRAITFKDAKIGRLTHEIARLRRLQYTAKTERMDPAQRELFDEAMEADIAALEAELEALREPAAMPAPKPPRTSARRTLPADLPRIETIHEPVSSECAQCGAALVKIGEHVSEKLDVEPLKFFVRKDIYPQYACRPCGSISAQAVAPAILDRGMAAPGLLAQVVIQKYTDAAQGWANVAGAGSAGATTFPCTARKRSSRAPELNCRAPR